MASVRLDFIPPVAEDMVELRVYEAPAKDGPFTQIEVVPVIGEFPDYISTYTTTFATNIGNWFAIDWYDAKGGNLGLSDSIKGNAQVLLGEIVNRVMTRDPEINENIIYDEAEAVLEGFLPAGTDLQDALITDTNARERSGLALLTQARCYLFSTSEGEEEYTVGLVTQKKKNSRSLASVQSLIRQAEADLGLSYSAIMQMMEPDINVSGVSNSTVDLTRLLVELQ